MNLGGIGVPGLLLILLLVLVLFGPKKLPELGRAVGRTLQEFRASSRGRPEPKHDAQGTGRNADATSE